jgi:hypothetical protein
MQEQPAVTFVRIHAITSTRLENFIECGIVKLIVTVGGNQSEGDGRASRFRPLTGGFIAQTAFGTEMIAPA